MLVLAFHDGSWYGVNLVVHQELFFLGQLHDNDSKIGSSKIERQELALLTSIGQVPDVSRETLDTRLHLTFFLQPFLCVTLQEKLFYFVISVLKHLCQPIKTLVELPPQSTLPSLLALYTEKPVWKHTHWLTKMYTLVSQ